uniref:Mediator of RNA polymerase II transcription subunit 22 n=1 Tax=Globodera pallida TaxID=36090 RepID=A0A183C9U7_GLOPA
MDRINNMPQNVASANNNYDVTVLLRRAREIVDECVGTAEALVEDFEKLLECKSILRYRVVVKFRVRGS